MILNLVSGFNYSVLRCCFIFCFIYCYFNYPQTVLAFSPQLAQAQPVQPTQPTQRSSVVCYHSQDLLEIEIGKEADFSTPEDPVFQFYARMTSLQVDPSRLTYTWRVHSPEGSVISPQPIASPRLVLNPDVFGTYEITLILQDSSQNCRYSVYIFQYPEMDQEDIQILTSIHAHFLDNHWTF